MTNILKLSGAKLIRLDATNWLVVYVHETIRKSRAYRLIIRGESSGRIFLNIQIKDQVEFPINTMDRLIRSSVFSYVTENRNTIFAALEDVRNQLEDLERSSEQETIPVPAGGENA